MDTTQDTLSITTDKNLQLSICASDTTNTTPESIRSISDAIVAAITEAPHFAQYATTPFTDASYWNTLLTGGNIFYNIHDGRVCVSLWVPGFAQSTQSMNMYSLNVKMILQEVRKERKNEAVVTCASCRNASFSYVVKPGNHLTGVCSVCKMRVHTVFQ